MAASSDLQEHANFTRLSRLLIDKGTKALRITLDAIHPPANLPAVLNGNKASLQKLKPQVIKDVHWDLLFPSPGNPPDSKTFDVTLLTVLLRSICWSTHPPVTGWNTMPPDTDRSPQANVVRIKLFRNVVYAHVTSTRMDGATFESLWQKISQALVNLKIPREEIDNLKISTLGPEEKSYVQKLKEWYLRDEDIRNMLDDLNTKVDCLATDVHGLTKGMQHLSQIVMENKQVKHDQDERPERASSEEVILQQLAKHNFKSKIARKVKSFHPGTREWLLKKVDEWFTTEDELRLLLLIANPGVGKSVFAAKVCKIFGKNGKLGACHFCDFSNSNLKDPMIMLQSLASQMCENVAGFKELLLDQLKRHHKVCNLNDAFQIYLQNPLDELEVEPFLIVIDGLDESATNEKSDMVKLVAEHFPGLPKSVKVLITSIPELSLQELDCVKKIDIFDDGEGNESDIQKYLKDCLPPLPQSSERFSEFNCISSIAKECEGSFLFAFHVQHELRQHKNLDTMTFEEIISALRQGLGSVYQAYFRRLESELKAVKKKEIDVVKLLEILAAPFGPLPVKFVARKLGMDLDLDDTKRIIGKVNDAISCLLYVSNDLVTVFHESVCDWLQASGYEDHEYAVKASFSNKQLWLLCKSILEEVKENVISGIELKLTKEVEHALENGYEYLITSGLTDSFGWLVDVVIVHVYLTIYPKAMLWLKEVLHKALSGDATISLRLRQQISWHFAEICKWMEFLMFTFPEVEFPYLETVVDYSPVGCFTESEIKIAKSLVANVPRCVNRYSFGATAMKTLLVKPFPSRITAIGISSNRQLAAVADSEGNVFILSLPELVTIWQYSTGYKNICCCVFAPSDSYLLYGTLETVLCIENKKEVTYFQGIKEEFKSCAFSSNGERLVTSDGSNAIKLWDALRQSLVSVLYSETPLNSCWFSKAGLFVIGSMNFADENSISQSSSSELFDAISAVVKSHCVWNAITFQRVDVRTLPIKKSKKRDNGGRSEICNRCSRPQHTGIMDFNRPQISRFLEPSSIQRRSWQPLQGRRIFFGMYNNMDSIFIFFRESLWVYECIHFTALAAWEMANPLLPTVRFDDLGIIGFDDYCTCIVDVAWIASDALLVSTDGYLIVFSSEMLDDYLRAWHPRRVLWCSFSPDSTRLATCCSDGFVILWNVSTCQVYQRVRNNVGTSLAACCWSNGHLFVFLLTEEIPKVTKYLIDENFQIDLTKEESVSLCCLVNEFEKFSRVIDFSQGYLSFETESVKVLNINKIDNLELAILPGSCSMPGVAISADASVAFGAGPAVFDAADRRIPRGHVILWKKSSCYPLEYEEIVDRDVDVPFSDDVLCCFSNDRKFAVAVALTIGHDNVVVVVDVDACTVVIKSDIWRGWSHLSKIFSTNMTLIIGGEKCIKIIDMQSLREIESSFQRCLSIDSLDVSKLSPNGKVMAVPNVTGGMEFFRLSIPAVSRIS